MTTSEQHSNAFQSPSELSLIPGEEIYIPKSWRDRLSIGKAITLLLIVSFLTAAGIIGTLIIRSGLNSRVDDAYTIFFLETERLGTLIQKEIERTTNTVVNPEDVASSCTGEALYRMRIDGTKSSAERVRGPFQPTYDLKELKINARELLSMRTVTSIGGEPFIVEPMQQIASRQGAADTYLCFKSIDFNRILSGELQQTQSVDTIAYIATRGGALVYTNTPKIVDTTLTSRPLIKQFIKSLVSQGQFEFSVRENIFKSVWVGYFNEITDTNLSLFVETPKSYITAPVRQMAGTFLLVVTITFVVIILVIQRPIQDFLAPIKEVTSLAQIVAKGNLDVRARQRGIGEAAVLSRAFTNMAEKMAARDETIKQLAKDHVNKVKFESELNIAKSIQENLLPRESLPPTSGLEMHGVYYPAEFCAGDWYTYFYDEVFEESTIVICDVSGHGVGSSLFTAMLAGVFNEVCERAKISKQSFPAEEFLTLVNSVIRKLGRGEWHATILILKFDSKTKNCDFFNCGHPFPQLITETGITSVDLKSNPVGIQEVPTIAHKKINFAPGTLLLSFTDGLSEARNKEGGVFGVKRIRESLKTARNAAIDDVVHNIISGLDSYRGKEPLKDDVCIIALRAA